MTPTAAFPGSSGFDLAFIVVIEVPTIVFGATAVLRGDRQGRDSRHEGRAGFEISIRHCVGVRSSSDQHSIPGSTPTTVLGSTPSTVAPATPTPMDPG